MHVHVHLHVHLHLDVHLDKVQVQLGRNVQVQAEHVIGQQRVFVFEQLGEDQEKGREGLQARPPCN